MENTKKAFGYLRVSGKGQVEGDGFDRQREAIAGYAAAHGIEIVRFFQEEGVSGTKDLENRPALQELMVALLSNGVRTVVIEKLDRLARDMMVQETILGDMRKNGFELLSVAEPDLCTDDPSRTLVRQMFGAVAQYEKSMLVIKLRVARQRMRIKTGRCEGRKSFGAREGEADTLAQLTSLRSSGLNYEQIARQMNEEGTKTRAGRPWFPATIRRILLAQ